MCVLGVHIITSILVLVLAYAGDFSFALILTYPSINIRVSASIANKIKFQLIQN